MHKKSILNCFNCFEEIDYEMFANENSMNIENEQFVHIVLYVAIKDLNALN